MEGSNPPKRSQVNTFLYLLHLRLQWNVSTLPSVIYLFRDVKQYAVQLIVG